MPGASRTSRCNATGPTAVISRIEILQRSSLLPYFWRAILWMGDPGSAQPRFRTFQVCPKDSPTCPELISVATRGNYCHLSTDQIGRQYGQSIVVTLGPTVLDQHVASFDIAGLAQALPKGRGRRRIFPGRRAVKEPDHRHGRLLRPCRERPRGPRRRGA
jgi:hypothetical protein